MRKILYLLPLLLVVLFNRIYSQQPIWPMVQIPIWVGNQIQYVIYIPLYSTQLVYQINLTQPTNLTFIQFTVPESILQQQLQYCKTYDPYVTNNVSLSQCAFIYPSFTIVYNSSNVQSQTMSGYEITYYMKAVSYDNITGLPQTFQILVNHNIGNLPPGTYDIYVYYPSPFYFSFDSMSNFSYMPACPSSLSNVVPSDFNGGWCTPGGGFGGDYVPNMNPMYAYPYSQSLYYYGCFGGCGVMINQYFTRYLYIKFNPAYPVFIGIPHGGINYVTITTATPNGQTATISTAYGSLYDLRELELQNGLNPNEYNEIVDVQVFADPFFCGTCGDFFLTGFYLQYVPET